MNPKPLEVRKYGRLTVEIYDSKEDCGRAAAERAAQEIRRLIEEKGEVNLVFSTGVSQFAFVAALCDQSSVDWSRCNMFHLDEYKGMSSNHPASFRLWLRVRVEEPLKPRVFHYIKGDAPDIEAECRRYAELLSKNPIDLGFVGIGENGHIAFNDPPVANFEDPELVKVVELDEACRRQQVGEGWFQTLDQVPTHAVTLTVPAIMSFKKIISVVPEKRKARAVCDALEGPIAVSCPASILRNHPNATLFLDKESASELS